MQLSNHAIVLNPKSLQHYFMGTLFSSEVGRLELGRREWEGVGGGGRGWEKHQLIDLCTTSTTQTAACSSLFSST